MKGNSSSSSTVLAAVQLGDPVSLGRTRGLQGVAGKDHFGRSIYLNVKRHADAD